MPQEKEAEGGRIDLGNTHSAEKGKRQETRGKRGRRFKTIQAEPVYHDEVDRALASPRKPAGDVDCIIREGNGV